MEYEAILIDLRVARSLGVKNILLNSDSKLVIGQINSEYKAKENRMQKYLKLTNKIVRELDQVNFIRVP